MNFFDDLVLKGFLTRDQLDNALEKAKKNSKPVDEILVSDFGLEKNGLLEAKGQFYNTPSKSIDAKEISFDVLKKIPADSARHYKIAPLGFTDDGGIEVGMVDPSDMDARNALQFISSKISVQFSVFVILESDFQKIMESYKSLSGEVDDALSEIDNENTLDADKYIKDEEKDLNQYEGENEANQEKKDNKESGPIKEDAPVTKIVAVMLRHAIEGGASDIHIENIGEKVKVRFRVDGVLHTSLFLPAKTHKSVVARIKILSNLKLDEKRKPQDGRFYAKIEGRKVDFRVSTMPAFFGEKVVIRILDTDKGVKSLEDLGLSEDGREKVKKALEAPYGMILLTGPTGSGKSTTLYSMLNEVDREKKNVVSLEDPIEYNVPDMNQSQIAPEIGYDFASGLRSILRQDPDVIMVGEIRDAETATLAIQAALTGHLVFSTLHTNNTAGVIPRLLDMGIDPYLIAPTMTLALAQRLVRKSCSGAEKPVPIEGSMKAMIDKQFEDLPEEYREKIDLGDNLHEVEGISGCPSGTKGRIAVFEFLQIDKEMERLILEKPNEMDVYAQARKSGMLTMKEDAIIKSAKGLIPFKEVNRL